MPVADQQGSEPGAGPLRLGEPAHHQLLSTDALGFRPVAGPSGTVRGVRPLGDDSLPSPPARLPEQTRPLTVEKGVDTYHLGWGDGRDQQPSAFGERQIPGRVAVEMEQVEHQVDDGDPGDQSGSGPDVHPLLEGGEPAFPGDDLAVEDEPTDTRQLVGHLGIRTFGGTPVTGEELYRPAIDPGEDPLPVDLPFEDPSRSGRRHVDRGGQHGFHPVGQRLSAKRSGQDQPSLSSVWWISQSTWSSRI